MRPKGRFRPSFTNVLVTIALFASLGGTSYAAIKVTGKNIKNNTVKSVDVKNHTLKRSDLRKGLLESTQAAPLDSIAYQADRAEGPTGVPAGSDYTVIATLNVAPGAYTVFSKVDLQADELAASHCQLQAGGKSDVSARGLRANNTPEAQNLQVAYTFGAPGAITLACKTSDGNWSATDAKILAVKVGTETG
jgi:hypothetical protein